MQMIIYLAVIMDRREYGIYPATIKRGQKVVLEELVLKCFNSFRKTIFNNDEIYNNYNIGFIH